MQVTEQAIRDVVDQVLAQMAGTSAATPTVAAAKDCACPGKSGQSCQCDGTFARQWVRQCAAARSQSAAAV